MAGIFVVVSVFHRHRPARCTRPRPSYFTNRDLGTAFAAQERQNAAPAPRALGNAPAHPAQLPEAARHIARRGGEATRSTGTGAPPGRVILPATGARSGLQQHSHQPQGNETRIGNTSSTAEPSSNLGVGRQTRATSPAAAAESSAAGDLPSGSAFSQGTTNRARAGENRIWVPKRRITPSPGVNHSISITPAPTQDEQQQTLTLSPSVQPRVSNTHAFAPLTCIGDSQGGDLAGTLHTENVRDKDGGDITPHTGDIQPTPPFFTSPRSGFIHPSRRQALNPALSSGSRWLDGNMEGEYETGPLFTQVIDNTPLPYTAELRGQLLLSRTRAC